MSCNFFGNKFYQRSRSDVLLVPPVFLKLNYLFTYVKHNLFYFCSLDTSKIPVHVQEIARR